MSPINSPSNTIHPPHLRTIQQADLYAVYTVEQAAHTYPWSIEILSNCLKTDHQCWLWQLDAQIIGHGIMLIGGGECSILNLCTHPAYQKRGFGQRMLLHLLNIGREYQADTAFLEVRKSNTAALKLYQRIGFNEIGIRRNYYPHSQGRMDAIILAKTLIEKLPDLK